MISVSFWGRLLLWIQSITLICSTSCKDTKEHAYFLPVGTNTKQIFSKKFSLTKRKFYLFIFVYKYTGFL